MLVKGTIIYIDPNARIKPPKAKVHIDRFDTTKKKSEDLECNICYTPGMLNSYKIGDIVFIDFLENEMGRPVIIGKFYSEELGNEDPEIPRGALNIQNLRVGNSAQFPLDIKIGDTLTGYHILQACSNSLLLSNRSIDLRSGEAAEHPVVAICRSPLDNLYGFDISTLGYNSINEGDHFLITKNGKRNLTEIEIEDYTEIMVGIRSFPLISTTKFSNAILFTNGTVGYLKVNSVNESTYELWIVRVTTASFTTESDIERVLDELANPVSITDLSNETTSVSGGIGFSVTSMHNGEEVSSPKLDFIDIYDD